LAPPPDPDETDSVSVDIEEGRRTEDDPSRRIVFGFQETKKVKEENRKDFRASETETDDRLGSFA
jgi:pyruvate/2-oxoacid:ferredoxin oxidoreductase alpha subunit